MIEKIEKQRFYISEFDQEAEWLALMHSNGWRFISTDGRSYKFESCKSDQWCYQLDYKENGTPDEDYIQMYVDYGWEYVFQYRNWFYFRKERVDEIEGDMSIFSDKESKIEFCRRVIQGHFLRILPLYMMMLVYDYILLFTDLLHQEGFIGGVLNGIAMGSILIVAFGFGLYISQISRLNHIINESEI